MKRVRFHCLIQASIISGLDSGNSPLTGPTEPTLALQNILSIHLPQMQLHSMPFPVSNYPSLSKILRLLSRPTHRSMVLASAAWSSLFQTLPASLSARPHQVSGSLLNVCTPLLLPWVLHTSSQAQNSLLSFPIEQRLGFVYHPFLSTQQCLSNMSPQENKHVFQMHACLNTGNII